MKKRSQKDKAKEQRNEMRKAVAEAVAKLTPEQRSRILEHYKAVVTIEERKLSDWNTWALCMQRVVQKTGRFEIDGVGTLPDLSIVGGFNQWKNHGRRVKKGEHAIFIAVPCFKGAQAKPEDGALIVPSELKSIEERENSPYFKFVPMFHISQTEAAEGVETVYTPQLVGETVDVESKVVAM